MQLYLWLNLLSHIWPLCAIVKNQGERCVDPRSEVLVVILTSTITVFKENSEMCIWKELGKNFFSVKCSLKLSTSYNFDRHMMFLVIDISSPEAAFYFFPIAH